MRRLVRRSQWVTSHIGIRIGSSVGWVRPRARAAAESEPSSAVDRTGLFQAQRGLGDTMLDLIADTLGALVTASAFVGLARRRI